MKKLLLIICFFFTAIAHASSIQEMAQKHNEATTAIREELKKQYSAALSLYEHKAEEQEYKNVLEKIKSLKQQLVDARQHFKEESVKLTTNNTESSAFLDLGEITISNLIMEYASDNYLYLIPFELGSMKLSLFSLISIPKESWDDIIEAILSYNGIGIQRINPYLRLLYVFKQDPSRIDAIISCKKDLEFLKDNDRIFFVLTPPADQLKNLQLFFERFSDPKQTIIQIMGSKLIIIAYKESIERMLNLYDVVWGKEQSKMIRIMPLSKINALDADKILRGFFADNGLKNRPSFYQSILEEIQIFPLPEINSLAFVGPQNVTQKAKELVEEIETQLEDPAQMTVYWYSCKYCEPEDLAAVLEKVYTSFSSKTPILDNKISSPTLPNTPTTKDGLKAFGNFIVDPKNSSLLMVIKKEDITKIEELLKKLDVPKKMVQIEVLLVEKKMQDSTQTGINLLQIGTGKTLKEKGITFDTNPNAVRKGMLSFLIGQHTIWPSFDLAMNFLIAQDNLQIKANPSIIAVNQTPALISIVEELSINTGAVQMEMKKGVALEKSYTRAQFGIVINMTPTIHTSDKGEKGFVTLKTNITFDTTQSSTDERPPVTKRHIENEVRIADGETIILGGLKRSSSEDAREKIPFLGDIPGIGKLFGSTKLNDSSTEMFIFITPHIINDVVNDLKKLKDEPLERRAGDISEFLTMIRKSEEKRKKYLFQDSLRLIFDENR
jgi:general secretion pathway protein D